MLSKMETCSVVNIYRNLKVTMWNRNELTAGILLTRSRSDPEKHCIVITERNNADSGKLQQKRSLNETVIISKCLSFLLSSSPRVLSVQKFPFHILLLMHDDTGQGC